MQLSPYLFFNGRCEAAFKFYEQCLGGAIVAMMTYEQTPMADHVAPEQRAAIVHARMTVGGMTLMGGDAPPEHFKTAQGFAVAFTVDAPEEAERVFAALSENGAVEMPIEETFWAVRFGMLTDQFGTPWMISCETAA